MKMVCKKLSLIQTEDGVRFWFQMRIVSKCNAKLPREKGASLGQNGKESGAGPGGGKKQNMQARDIGPMRGGPMSMNPTSISITIPTLTSMLFLLSLFYFTCI